ncbi:MAG: tRNA dihydrouridine synthase DusB [Lachnospiraceae bacterium]|nr:tRNA dihydrouridine synthase DusB [Lachnospiraceae bacterium]
MKKIRIGSVELRNNLILAPMAGITDLPFRLLCAECGTGLTCMEMISAKAILYHNKNTEEMMKISPDEHPVSLQLFGSDPEVMGRIAGEISARPFEILDINMGCPMPKIVNNGEGSALMKDPGLVRRIVSSVVKGTDKPVTVKIRKGFDAEHVNAVEIAKICEDAGASAVAVHGRTREQMYEGRADWEIIAKVKEALSIPVIGNGDVTDGPSAEKMLKETNCDAVMIGRAARGNPWIFRKIAGYLEQEEDFAGPTLSEILDTAKRHAKMLAKEKGEYIAVREMRKHIGWYVQGLRNASSIRREVCAVTELENLMNFLDAIRENEYNTLS